MKKKHSLSLLVIVVAMNILVAQDEPMRLGIAGLSHGHVDWILGREENKDVKIVGYAESDKELAMRLADKYGFSMNLVYDSVEEMIAKTKPEAVAAFGNIYDHLSVVEISAPKGVHVMVEKPLAISLDHAQKMEELVKKHNIHLLTNYETSWYPTNKKAHELLDEGVIGELRKVIVRNGHKGFNVNDGVGINHEFQEWLTDPALSGGGAIMDFGCYGANLITWLQNGKRPNSVTAVTLQLQPEINPKVDDDATIILTYDTAMAILEPSWNWPIGRKDMELYGTKGVVYADNRNQLRIRISEGYDGFKEEIYQLEEREPPFDDPFALFAAVVMGELKLEAFDPYSLENNIVTMEIMEAALKSAETGSTIKLEK